MFKMIILRAFDIQMSRVTFFCGLWKPICTSALQWRMLEPQDYCALYCRSPNRLRVVNAHAEVVEALEAALARHHLDYRLYWSSRATCAFKLHGEPFQHLRDARGGKAVRDGVQVEGPVVDGPIMALVEDDLGSEVVGSAAKSPKLAILDPLGQAEIHHLQIAVAIHDEIFRLEVTVADLAGVNVVEGEEELIDYHRTVLLI